MSSRRRSLAAILTGVALVFALPAGAAQAKKTITISGSTSVFPLTVKLARQWVKTKDGSKFSFRILQGGSNVGVSDVARGRVTIGGSSRDPSSADPGGLVFTRISRDALCIVTHASNPVGNLSQAQIQSIFLNTQNNWAAVGGTAANPINQYGRNPTSGTFDAFRAIFMAGQPESGTTQTASNGLVAQRVKDDPSGIGYVSLAFAEGLNVVNYNGVVCDLRNAKSGAYGGTRSFYFVTEGAPVGGARKFIRWVTKSRKANKIVGTEWVPLR